MSTTDPPRQRRTQEERRAATQAALLDATIECLVEYGYGGTTTTRVVERAGVSRGAQVHYYPQKSDLVAEAVHHLALKRAEELSVDLVPTGPRRVEAAVDALWLSHSGQLYQAAVELVVAARTDPELAERMKSVEAVVNQQIADAARSVFGKAARTQAFAIDFGIVTATMRGLALIQMGSEDPADAERHWRATRKRLIAMLKEHVTD